MDGSWIVNGWMDRQTDRWTDGWMDGQTNGRMDGWIMDGQVDGCTGDMLRTRAETSSYDWHSKVCEV